jgi:CelD/BcsL family acetyltransferase involved in cellulose biosynthesis
LDHHTHAPLAEFSVHSESFESVSNLFAAHGKDFKPPRVFMLPDWIRIWWKTFGEGYEPLLLSVKDKERVLGLALLKQKGGTVSFMGSADICDYFDFIVAEGREAGFFSALLGYLVSARVKMIDLRCLRPESTAREFLIPLAKKQGFAVEQEPDGVSFEVDLPKTREDYLLLLNSKQRHELRRKFRRLYDAGDVRFEVHGDLQHQTDKVDLFFSLFKQSRPDKEEFMTPRMESFFRDMLSVMSAIHILKMGVLLLNDQVVAIVLFFDHLSRYDLYNNGYNPAFNSLSIGLLAKAMAIEHAIDEKKKTFDFLKGEEIYKSRLGGRKVEISRWKIHLE